MHKAINNSATRCRLAARILTGFRLSLLVVLAFVAAGVQAKPSDYLRVSNVRNIDLGTWTGLGGLASTQLFCVASADNDASNPPPSATQMPYQVKVDDDSGAGDFTVYLGGNTGGAANERIRISMQHMDVIAGGGQEQLSEGVYDNHAHVGAWKNCPNGDNSQIRVEISASELAGKVSGSYRGDFTFTAIGGASGANTQGSSFRVTVSVQAAPEVQITRLDDMLLGSHGGLGNIYAEENFCVYSTSGSGSYTLSVSSNNQDGSGNFFLAGGLGEIPYDLYFTDQSSGPGTTKVSTGSLSGFGDSGDPFCNGQNNATLSISITERNLQQAKSGSYSDSLVILVSPQ